MYVFIYIYILMYSYKSEVLGLMFLLKKEK